MSKEEIHMPSILTRRHTLLGTVATALTAGSSTLLLPGDASACHKYVSPYDGRVGCGGYRRDQENPPNDPSQAQSSPPPTEPSPPPTSDNTPSGSGDPQVSGPVITVSNSSQLTQALKNASAGQTIELANGNYNGSFKIDKNGNKNQSILIKAKNKLKAVLQEQIFVHGDYVIVSCLGFKGAGVTLFGANCRVTRCYFNGSKTAVSLEGAVNAEIDHNEITAWVHTGVDCDPTYNGRKGTNPRIYRNHFHNGVDRNRNTAINLGQQAKDQPVAVNGLVEYNLVENANKKYKTIYCKSSSNTIRYNTIINAQGMENRHGRNNKFIGNWLENCNAFVVADENCQVEGNRLKNVRNGIRVMAGDISSSQVPNQGGGVPFSYRCQVIENDVDTVLKIGSKYSGWKQTLPARQTSVSGHKGKIALQVQKDTTITQGNPGNAGKKAKKLTAQQVGPYSA